MCGGVGCPGKRYVALHGGGVDNCMIPIGEVCRLRGSLVDVHVWY